MPVGVQQPQNVVKLTNISLVRFKKGKKRFELACYKNKVLEWRAGYEKDLDNVLQIHNVFLDVSKGRTAPNEDLRKAFGDKTSRDDIILEILKKGELQIGEKERNEQLDRLHRQVLDIVSRQLVDPRTKRVYTTGMVDKALDQIASLGTKGQHSHPASGTATPVTGENGEGKAKPDVGNKPHWTGVVTTRSAKSQALDAMKALIAHQIIPIARARMRLRITCPTNIAKQTVKPNSKGPAEGEDGDDKAAGSVKDKILGWVEEIESQDVTGEDWELTGFFEPGAYKLLTELSGAQTKGRLRVEVLDMAVVHED